ncbi:hypothetical protein KKC1_24000 [Calderihabitans maritimus]|uniref:Uncharacterized protein n=1 Tax=Calderihabitans maritimus TaxID=1246530 RepID=A0A1Z5HVA1_9FIRM|nr:hypothetical protein KKC1_24000 [Calderihabitans maritimus]
MIQFLSCESLLSNRLRRSRGATFRELENLPVYGAYSPSEEG